MAEIRTKKAEKTSALGKSEGPMIDLEEKIRQRAYQLYESRGRGDGRDFDDWLQAEAEVSAGLSKRNARPERKRVSRVRAGSKPREE